MAFSIGNGRYCKLFPGNAPPKRVLIKDLSEPGLLSRAFIQGTVVKVYPIKCSARFGKLCKILLKEDVEKSTRRSQLTVINTFLLEDLADEGSRISEGDCVVLAEVIVECSPTGEHQFQLIAWREKSQASIWVVNNKGKVRSNTPEGMATTSIDEVEEAEITTNNKPTADNYDDSADSDKDLFESCESDFSKLTSNDGKEISEQTKQEVFEKRKGKFHLGPKGVTPSTSHVKRRYDNLAVILDKGDVKMVMKAYEEEKYHSKSKTANVHSKDNTRKEYCVCCQNISTETHTCTKPVPNARVLNAGTPHTETLNAVTPNAGTPCAGTSNAGVPNACSPNAGTPNSRRPNAGMTSAGGIEKVNASHASPASRHAPSKAVKASGQSPTVAQKTGSGRGTGSLSLNIQLSTSPDKRSNTQLTRIELTPSRVSTRIRNGDFSAGLVRDQSQKSAVSNDLPQPMATDTGQSSSKVCEEDSSLEIGDFQDKPSEDSVMLDFEQEEQLGMSACTTSASSEIHHGSPAKGTTDRNFGSPHRLRVIAEELVPLSNLRTMIPDDYTPASSLLANQDSTDRGVRRSPLQSPLDPKRLKTSAVPSHEARLPDQAGNTFSDSSRRRSSRAAVYTSRATAYTVPPGYTTLANLQADTTVNVYGVVKLFKPAWKCRGTDMCSVLMLMDPTIAESSTGLECVLFQPSVSRLPAAHRIGDIVRLHRVKISQYQGRLQAKSTRGFAAIVFDRETELPVTAEMARVSSSTFTLTQTDKETVERLKNWCDVQPVLFPLGSSVTLSQINPDSYFDLTCQVLGMALHRTLDCVVLYVTDGTKPAHDLRNCTGDEYNVVEPPRNRSSQDDDVTSVFLYGSHAEVAHLLVRKGGYVILHNVHSLVLKPGGSVSSVLDVVKPYLELCVHRGTAFGRGISVLSADSPEVNQLKRQQKL